MSACDGLAWTLIVLAACFAGAVAIGVAGVAWINLTVARICKEDEQHDPY